MNSGQVAPPSRRLSGGRPFGRLRAGARPPLRGRDALAAAGKMPALRHGGADMFPELGDLQASGLGCRILHRAVVTSVTSKWGGQGIQFLE